MDLSGKADSINSSVSTTLVMLPLISESQIILISQVPLDDLLGSPPLSVPPSVGSGGGGGGVGGSSNSGLSRLQPDSDSESDTKTSDYNRRLKHVQVLDLLLIKQKHTDTDTRSKALVVFQRSEISPYCRNKCGS
jgi:hypothetical protein